MEEKTFIILCLLWGTFFYLIAWVPVAFLDVLIEFFKVKFN
jgi:hypothetical protein